MRKVQSVGGAGKIKEDNDENFQICLKITLSAGVEDCGCRSRDKRGWMSQQGWMVFPTTMPPPSPSNVFN